MCFHTNDKGSSTGKLHIATLEPSSLKLTVTAGVLEPRVSTTEAVKGILADMAKTYEERNIVYKDNWTITAKMLEACWPDGVPKDVVSNPVFNLFITKLGKLARFANSNLKHLDSIHDDALYSVMIEAIMTGKLEHEEE